MSMDEVLKSSCPCCFQFVDAVHSTNTCAFMQTQQQPYYSHYIPTLPPLSSPSPYTMNMETYNATNYNAQPLPFSYHPPSSLRQLTSLREKISKQLDYYFSDDNLAKDVYLRKRMDEEGWVPISLIAGFPRISQLKKDSKFVLESLIYSDKVEVQGDKVRQRDNWKKWLPKFPKQEQET